MLHGVAQSRDTAVSVSLVSRLCRRPLHSASSDLAVGHDEEPLPAVRGADFRRSDERLRNSVAQAFQLVSDGGVGRPSVGLSNSDQPADIFQNNERRSRPVDSPPDVRPEVARVFDAATGAGHAEGLAGKARQYAIHCATPASTVEGAEISPDRSGVKTPVCHARRQYETRR